MNTAQLALKDQIFTVAPDRLISTLVLERIPHICNNDWELLRTWRAQLAPQLDVDPCDIFFTGSAALGYSLNPYKELKPFDAASDIDVAVVSAHHFDVAWRHIRTLRRAYVDPEHWLSIQSHKSNYVYWGCIACDQLLPILPFGAQWLAAFEDMRKVSPTVDRDISCRIYRDAVSLRGYQVQGLLKLKSEL